MPRLLTDYQKENRVEISQELLANANGNENFLKNIITGDETWVYGMMLKSRCNHHSGWGKGLLGREREREREARMSRSKIKVVMFVFFDWKRIVHHEFLPRGQMINKQLYQEVFSAFEGCCAQEEA